MQKNNSRKLQAVITKKKILSCSLEMIKEQGYDNVKIKEICDKVGVSVGAFYHHFKSKEGIVIEGYTECDEYFENVVMKNLSSEDELEKITEYLSFQGKYAENLGVELITQIYKLQVTNGTEFFLSPKRILPKNLLDLIEDAQKNKRLTNETKASEIRDEILIISRGIIYNWCQNKGNFDLSEKIIRLTSKFLFFYKSQ